MKDIVRNHYVYEDGAHAWLCVKRDVFGGLGIEDKISPYSYKDWLYVYLEEDCDAGVYIKAWEKKYGTKFKTKGEVYENYPCFVRNLESYSAGGLK